MEQTHRHGQRQKLDFEEYRKDRIRNKGWGSLNIKALVGELTSNALTDPTESFNMQLKGKIPHRKTDTKMRQRV
jgi:hypothetical protein